MQISGHTGKLAFVGLSLGLDLRLYANPSLPA